ncbi:hypothetical protein P7K49_018575, partial [Saguinus oedipus]
MSLAGGYDRKQEGQKDWAVQDATGIEASWEKVPSTTCTENHSGMQRRQGQLLAKST